MKKGLIGRGRFQRQRRCLRRGLGAGAGECERGLNKLDGATEIYRRHGAGQRRVELAESEKTPLREV